MFAWDMSSEAVKDAMKSHPALLREAAALPGKKKGMLLELVNAETGVSLDQVVIPEVELSGGWNDERRAVASGEFVLARGERGNTDIYKVSNGEKVGEFFGSVMTSDAKLVVAINREDEVVLIEENSGKELRRFSLGSPVLLARIVGGGKLLLVLTADQVVHRVAVGE